jgi:Flp pilus assembly protein TadB
MEVAKPFAMRLMSNGNQPSDPANLTGNLITDLSRQAAQMGNTALGLPRRIEDTLERLDRGDIRVRVRSTETDRLLRRLNGINLGLNYTLLVCAFTLSATILWVNHWPWMALMALCAAALATIAWLRVMFKLNKFDRLP